MKSQLLSLIALLSAACLFATIRASGADHPVNVTNSSDTTDTTTVSTPLPAAVTAGDPFGEMKTALQAATLSKHDGLSAVQDRMERNVTDRISEWKATGRTAPTETEEQLSRARTDFRQKIETLATAQKDTWETAKNDALVSLHSVEGLYQTLIAGPVEK